MWKKKGDGFLLFFESIFLRNRSFSNVKWVFGKKRKIERETCIFLEIEFIGRKEKSHF